MLERKLWFTKHARQRMLDWDVSVTTVRRVVENGEVIEEYPDDEPYPSRLILGWDERRPLHVVAADRTEIAETIIITVYEPSREQWENDFRTRSET